MKNPFSSFILHLSSVFRPLFSVPAVLSLLTFVLWQGTAHAQTWIIDGQQTQTLNLNVSDPQAIHTDGSRSMEAPLEFSSSHTDTGAMFRAYIPWDGRFYDLFGFDENEEALILSPGQSLMMNIGDLNIDGSAINHSGAGSTVDLEGKSLGGGWKTGLVPDHNQAIMNRGYADTRYLRSGVELAETLTFDQTFTATSGVMRIYVGDEDTHLSFFSELQGDVGLLFCPDAASAGLLFGSDSNGLLINRSELYQTSGQRRLVFSDGILEGETGHDDWHVVVDPTADTGIVNKGYADANYLKRTEGITTNRVIQAGDTLIISNGLITAINP